MHSRTEKIHSSAEALRYPWENHPGHDQVVEVAPGVLWARLRLPFRLTHVNIYLLADGAGWITERFGCPLFMSQVEYLQSVYHQNRGTEERRNAQRLFFRRHGMDEDLTEKLLGRGQDYLKRVSVLPPVYRRLSHGDEVVIGTRRFK